MLSFFVLPRLRSGEVFPVFTWWLFSRTPHERTDYGIEIISIKGVALNQPTPLEEISAGIIPSGTDDDYYMVIQRLGRALSKNDVDELKTARRSLEEFFLGGRETRYKLVKRTFDPIERYKNGTFLNKTELGEFEAGVVR